MFDRQKLIVLPFAMLFLLSFACSSGCPQGRVEIDGRCKSIEQLIAAAKAGNMADAAGTTVAPVGGQMERLPTTDAGRKATAISATQQLNGGVGGTATGTTTASGSPPSMITAANGGSGTPTSAGVTGSAAGNPSGAAAAAQPACGNGKVEDGETCDPVEECPDATTCKPTTECFQATLSGNPKNCDSKCEQIPIDKCVSGDGCCPTGCNFGTDEDCSKSCGDGVVTSPETCEPNSPQPCPSECDDDNICTTDALTGSPTQCNAACAHTKIESGTVNDCGGCKKLPHAKGESCTAGSASCIGRGQYTCDGQNNVVCNAVPNTAPERCDGTDNDCDGKVDEDTLNRCGGCRALDRDVGSACTTGANGSCRGTYVCDGKDATVCKAQNANPELCDNVDNDCDGTVDEDTSQGTSCQITKGTCTSNGKWACKMGASVCDAPPIATVTEICGNGKDDDCDSNVDETESSGQAYPPAWFLDCDGDGFGNPAIATNACAKPADVKGCHFVSRSGSDPAQADCKCLK